MGGTRLCWRLDCAEAQLRTQLIKYLSREIGVNYASLLFEALWELRPVGNVEIIDG